MHTYRFVIGDWRGKWNGDTWGHHVSTEKTREEIQDALEMLSRETGVNIYGICGRGQGNDVYFQDIDALLRACDSDDRREALLSTVYARGRTCYMDLESYRHYETLEAHDGAMQCVFQYPSDFLKFLMVCAQIKLGDFTWAQTWPEYLLTGYGEGYFDDEGGDGRD